MAKKKGPSHGPLCAAEKPTLEYSKSVDTSRESFVCQAVAVGLAIQELDHLKAFDKLPAPSALLSRLVNRGGEFDLIAGVALAYLRIRGVASGNSSIS